MNSNNLGNLKRKINWSQKVMLALIGYQKTIKTEQNQYRLFWHSTNSLDIIGITLCFAPLKLMGQFELSILHYWLSVQRNSMHLQSNKFITIVMATFWFGYWFLVIFMLFPFHSLHFNILNILVSRISMTMELTKWWEPQKPWFHFIYFSFREYMSCFWDRII